VVFAAMWPGEESNAVFEAIIVEQLDGQPSVLFEAASVAGNGAFQEFHNDTNVVHTLWAGACHGPIF
jgi:hypothetical protein